MESEKSNSLKYNKSKACPGGTWGQRACSWPAAHRAILTPSPLGHTEHATSAASTTSAQWAPSSSPRTPTSSSLPSLAAATNT